MASLNQTLADRPAPPQQDTSGLLVIVTALFAVLVWAGTPIVTKIAVTQVDPLAVGMLRTLVVLPVAICLLAFGKAPRPRGRVEWQLLLVSAIAGFVAFPLLFSLGLKSTTSAHGALIVAMGPILTGFIAHAAMRELPPVVWWSGVAVAFAGAYALIGLRFGYADEGAGMRGDLLALAGVSCAAVGYVAGSHLSRRMGTWSTTLWGITLAGILLAPGLGWLTLETRWWEIDAAGWLAIAYLGLLSTWIAYVAWYWALAAGGIARVSTLQFLLPIAALALSVGILDEALTPPLILAAAAILTGIYLARRRQPGST